MFCSGRDETASANRQEIAMSGKKTLIALSAALALGVLGAASAAQASDRESTVGGFRIGPLGQVMGARSLSTGANAYGFVSPTTKHERTRYQRHD
jgi:hypothetical protein